MPISIRRRTVARLALMLTLVGLAVGVSPGTASAHAGLETSIPAASATLDEAPNDIVLDFDEPIDAGISSIQLFDASAQLVVIGEPVPSQGDDSIVLAGLPDLADGIYAVVWRVASVDGHIIDGAFSFQIGTGTTSDVGALLDQVRAGASASPSVGRAANVARLLGFAGLTLTVGAGVYALMAGPLLADRRVDASPAGRWMDRVVRRHTGIVRAVRRVGGRRFVERCGLAGRVAADRLDAHRPAAARPRGTRGRARGCRVAGPAARRVALDQLVAGVRAGDGGGHRAVLPVGGSSPRRNHRARCGSCSTPCTWPASSCGWAACSCSRSAASCGSRPPRASRSSAGSRRWPP